jgi:hypothetical protein
MTLSELIDVMQSATAMGCLIAAIFFFRYWVLSRDTLFILFAIAFGLLSASWFGLALTTTSEHHREIYLIRMVAFLLIIVAIILKNRGTDD